MKSLSKEFDVPLPFGYRIKGRYDRITKYGPNGIEYGDYYDQLYQQVFERMVKRFARSGV